MKLDEKNKEVLVYGINFYPELTGIGKYTGDMVDWLVSKNIKCTVITAYPYYPYWEIQKPYGGYFYKKEVSVVGPVWFIENHHENIFLPSNSITKEYGNLPLSSRGLEAAIF